MTEWIFLLGGIALSAAGTGIAVAAAAVSRLELARWISQRLRGAAIAGALLSTPGRVLGAATGLSTAGLLIAAMGLNALLSTVAPLARATAVVLLGVPLLITAGYAIPRTVGRRWPERVMRRSAPVIERVVRALTPLIPTPQSSSGDMARVMRAGQLEGALAADDLTLFSGVVSFAERPVRDIMTPRTEILAVPDGAPVTDVARLIAESGYSRLPVYRESLDNIVGMVYAFDLLKVEPGGKLTLRPVHVVPGSKRCADLLYELQRDGRQLAVVLDEFGGTAGVATVDDLLTELVTGIFDEPGVAPGDATPAVELVEVEGTTPVAELAARFGPALAGETGSVGGLLARGAGRIPHPGERFLYHGLEFDVLAASATRVDRVAVRRGAGNPIAIRGA